jgi:hypothetical protein
MKKYTVHRPPNSYIITPRDYSHLHHTCALRILHLIGILEGPATPVSSLSNELEGFTRNEEGEAHGGSLNTSSGIMGAGSISPLGESFGKI